MGYPARSLQSKQSKSPDAIKAITMTVAQTDGVKDADSSEEFEQSPAPKAKAAPVEDDAPEAATPEPTKRASKKDDAPAPKKDVSKILEEWDDE